MFREYEFNKPSYKVGEIAKLLNVTVKTVQNWDKSGKLRVNRTVTNRREIFREDLLEFLEKTGRLEKQANNDFSRIDVIFVRLTNKNIEQGETLEKQTFWMMSHIKDLNSPLIVQLDDTSNDKNQKNFDRLIDMIIDNKINRIIVRNKKDFVKSNFSAFEKLINYHKTYIVEVGAQ